MAPFYSYVDEQQDLHLIPLAIFAHHRIMQRLESFLYDDP